MNEIQITLGIAYYNQGFFNIGVNHQYLIGEHNDLIAFTLGDAAPFDGTIDRTANPNGTPRIMCGHQYTQFVQQHFNQGDNMTVQIYGLHAITIPFPQ